MNKRLFIYKLILVLSLFFLKTQAQIVPPYQNDFDQTSDTVGWIHYAINGSDDWGWGAPSSGVLNAPFSASNVWAASLNGYATSNSHMALQSPSFDFSNTSINWRLTFVHQYNIEPNGGSNIEYSIDNGVTWSLLNGTSTEKYNWYNSPNSACTGTAACFYYGYFAYYKLSIHRLGFLSGQSNVKFRFKLCSGGAGYEGWMIDNFRIEEDKPNLFGKTLPLPNVTKNCPGIIVNTNVYYSEINVPTFTNQSKYYLSTNTILDAGDLLVLTTTNTLTSSLSILPVGFNLPPAYQSAGTKYLLLKLDALNNMNESSETDNIVTYTITVDSVYNVPSLTNFETPQNMWTTSDPTKWVFGPGDVFQYEYGHSSRNAVGNIHSNSQYQANYIETPLFDSKAQDSTLISFWYRCKNPIANIVQFSQGCANVATSGVIGSAIATPLNKWQYVNHYFPQTVDTSRMARIRITSGNGSAFPSNAQYQGWNLLLDDIYIGKAMPDLSIEYDIKNRYTPSNDANDTLRYTLFNSGPKSCASYSTSFYWSADTVLDASDVFLGLKPDISMAMSSSLATQFIYSKPTTAPGTYYIFYLLDTGNVINEMREYNNRGYFVVNQETKQTIPYYNDFETQITGWWHTATFNKDELKWTIPAKPGMNYAYSGVKAWMTNDTGVVSPNCRMHLYSPIFDLTSAIKPVLEFDVLNNILALNVSYSTDEGVTWKILDTLGKSENRWYYGINYDPSGGLDGGYTTPTVTTLFYDLQEPVILSPADYNGRDCKRTYRSNVDIKQFAGVNRIRFRFNMASNSGSTGVMLDNFRIAEGKPDLLFDFKKSLMVSSNVTKLKLNGIVKNAGNYICNAGTLDFYLSADSVVGNDYLLGSRNYNAIRPDNYFYFNTSFNTPAGFPVFKYLVIVADASNTSSEINEANNSVLWPLALDSIKNTSYFNNFSDTIINGWTGYSLYQNAIYGHRLRNWLPPAGNFYQFNYKSGELFTDQVGPGTWDPDPMFYIESPKFDFSGSYQMQMSFKLMCTGLLYNDGGIMEYSTNGGNTFSYLNLSSAAQGLYGGSLSVFGGVPGWTGQIGITPTMQNYAQVQADISAFAGQKDIVFRFRYKSNHYFTPGGPHGLRIDDFGINVITVDYKANNINNTVTIQPADTAVTIHYNYSIVQPNSAPATNIKFYWSYDAVFGSNDSLILVKNVPSTVGPSTIYDSLSINLNQTSFYNTGYVFYKIEKDSVIIESNELNNVGSYVILNGVGLKKNTAGSLQAYCYMNNLYVNAINQFIKNPYNLVITDAAGKKVNESVLIIKNGNNIFSLPENLAKGIYLITLFNGEDYYTIKYIVN